MSPRPALEPDGGGGTPSTTALCLTALSFVIALSILLFADTSPAGERHGANVESRSAIGYRAFRELLEATGVEVSVVRHDAVERARGGLLVVTSPPLDSDSLRTSVATLRPASNRLLVTLPKWKAWPEPRKPGWIAGATLLPTDRYDALLGDLGLEPPLTRPDTVRVWTTNVFGIDPTITSPQLLRDPWLTPLVAGEEGMLVARSPLGNMIVVSDPDLMNNAGIGLGRNAALVAAIVNAHRPATGGVYLDLSVHETAQRTPLAREAIRFPFVLVVVQGLIVLGMLLWSTTTRFGPALTTDEGHAAGKTELIETTAHLMATRGFHAQMLGRYFARALRTAAEHHHLPRGLTEIEIVHRLDAVASGQQPGSTPDRESTGAVTALRDRIRAIASSRHTPAEVVAVARDVHHWHQEMTHGAH